jgi:hypothetical protein
MSDLALNKEIYTPLNIHSVIEVFSNLCKVDIGEEGNYWIATFCECKYDKTRTIKEFENYLIDYMNAKE